MLKPKPSAGSDHYDYLKALMVELKIMIHLGKHINILNVLGACTQNLKKRELLVITEYCKFGNIQKYLVSHRQHFVNQINPASGDIDFDIGRQEYNDLANSYSPQRSIERAPSSASGRKSVRYVVQPRPTRTVSVMSEYPDDGQIVMTGMTTLQTTGGVDEGSDVSDETRKLRTLSSISTVEPDPIWRANVSGDYDRR